MLGFRKRWLRIIFSIWIVKLVIQVHPRISKLTENHLRADDPTEVRNTHFLSK